MKNVAALTLAVLLACRLPAQLPSGSVVPDFIANDLTGQTWHLYDLLEEGKTVVVQVSATWCPPCWAYHSGGALADLYGMHGPEGDNRVQVFLLEGDPATNNNCLYGPNGCNDITFGNWVAGTPYPILNNTGVANTLDVTYYPTIYVICPNKKVYEIGQLDADQLWDRCKLCPVATGVNNAGIFEYSTGNDLHEICEILPVAPEFKLINLGSNPLTAATINLQWNGVTQQTYYWTGNLPLYGETAVKLDTFDIQEPGTLKTTLVSINNGPGDDDFSNNVRNNSFSIAKEFNHPKILLRLRTDEYGAETYWELRDAQGVVLDKGGNIAVGPNGGGKFPLSIETGPGAYPDMTLIRDTLTLPGPGCYSFHIVDAFGDGMCCNYGTGYYRLFNIDNPATPILSGGEFLNADHRGFKVLGTVATPEPEAMGMALALYPNPATFQIQADFELPSAAPVQCLVLNALGQVVYDPAPEQLPAGLNTLRVPTESWPPGMYWLCLQSGARRAVEKFVVMRM